MAKISKMTIPNVDKDMEQQELSFIVGETTKWYSPFGRWCFFAKLNILLPCNLAVMLLGIYGILKRMEYLHTHKNLHTDFYVSFFLNCQNLEATNMSSSG